MCSKKRVRCRVEKCRVEEGSDSGCFAMDFGLDSIEQDFCFLFYFYFSISIVILLFENQGV